HDPAAHDVRQEGLDVVVLLLAPIVPHIAHVLWQALGHPETLVDSRWPVADPAALARDELDLVVQVNGRKRALIRVGADADSATCEAAAQKDANVQRFTDGKTIRKIVVVPGKLVNIVVQD
ncbi:MAG: class I tRNA ligase family protein, partial [Gammaproteobacteria bacterium]